MVKTPNSEKIIFLDIDGVLNNKISAAQGVHLQPSKVIKVRDLCIATGALVVITSTWRIRADLKMLKELLWATGFSWEVHRIVGVTPNHYKGHRGSEIEMYITQHPEVGKYIIIDDDTDFFDYQKKFFVQTHWATGIMDEHVKKAIELLGRK